ncbi:MAG TPA: GxxExxY protein [Fimbriiglobus sp.]|nr:GxxExxY protein [Fimbriiglobus sp.]
MDERDPLTEQVIGAAIEVHRLLGPGLLESIYQKALCHELTLRGVRHQPQQPVPVSYKGVDLGDDLFMDILVEDDLVVELKAVERLEPIHEAQLLTYLKLSRRRLGLLINFNVRLLKDGVRRRIL